MKFQYLMTFVTYYARETLIFGQFCPGTECPSYKYIDQALTLYKLADIYH